MSRIFSSILWDYFDKTNLVDKKAKCRVCGDSYSYKGTTGNLKAHLKKKHLDSYTRVTTGQQDIRSSQTASVGQIITADTSATVSTSATITTLANPTTASTSTAAHPTVSPPRHVRQQGIERYRATKKISGDLKRKIDNDVLDLFIDSYHPFTLVEERAFKKVMRWIPGYQLPTRKTISNVMIPALYNKTVETLKTTTLGSIEHLCLTADLWTSRANESYLAVTGHFITEEFELKTILLDCSNFEDSHTSENIQNT